MQMMQVIAMLHYAQCDACTGTLIFNSQPARSHPVYLFIIYTLYSSVQCSRLA